jgi:ABC-2 type transport system ATP-binding protein
VSTIIETHELVKAYGDLKAVDHLNLAVEEGHIFSLLGPNGAGKTTTVEILEGLRTPTSGSATVLGHDVRTEYGQIRHQVGILPQDFEPFDRLTPREAIVYWGRLFARSLPKERVATLLDDVGLQDRAGVQGLHLSGGEKRKLGIAMSLVGDPDLLFLDEPTTGLDPKARRDLWTLILRIKKAGHTVLLTTHYLDEAEHLADDVGIMHKGKLVARGSPGELIATLGSQTTIVLGGAGSAGLKELERRGIPATMRDADVLVRVSDPAQMRVVLAKLASIEISMKDMYTVRGTLEDVFLSLVGTKMEEGVLQA